MMVNIQHHGIKLIINKRLSVQLQEIHDVLQVIHNIFNKAPHKKKNLDGLFVFKRVFLQGYNNH